MDLRNETKREKRWSCRRWYDLREIYFSRCNIRMRIEIRCRIMNFYLSYLYTVTIGGISSSIISSVPRNESPDICQSHTGNSINCSLFMPLFDKLSWQTIESNRVKSIRGNGDWSKFLFVSKGTIREGFPKRSIHPPFPPSSSRFLKLLENCRDNSLEDSLEETWKWGGNRARSRGTNDLSTGGCLAMIYANRRQG